MNLGHRFGVVVVDDHALVRAGIVRVIGGAPDMEVLGECGDADEAVTIALRVRPDILLMDIDMPGSSIFECADTVRSHVPSVRLVFLTAHPNDGYIERALAIGASGYLTKSESPEAMLEALRRVAAGRTSFSEAVQARLVLGSDGARLAKPSRTRISTLSPREIEVLTHIATGLTKKEIAGLMHLSVKTIDNHSTNLMGKLDIHDRVGLARFAVREGLIVA